MSRPRQNVDFERFYYSKVALGESCGCAEQIIGTRDLDARAEEGSTQEPSNRRFRFGPSWLTRFFGWKL